MKRFFALTALICALAAAIPAQAGSSPNAWGIIYQNTTTPGDGFNLVTPAKSGSAVCKSIFALVSTGNCSVKEAMRNGGITQLSHYDVQRENILGIQTITVRAYGR